MTITRLRAARALGLLLLALSALPAPAALAARPAAHDAQLTLTIRTLPEGRMTMGQLAAYYYGAPQMSFVIENANTWLHGVRPDRPLATYAKLGKHRTIHIPTMRGLRPVGPS